MNCEECQDLISVFLDNELDDEVSAVLQLHLAVCGECAKICEDFAVILANCNDNTLSELVPPNSKALWCRINNLIEAEVPPERPNAADQEKRGFRKRFTFSQLGVAVACVALISSFLTVVGFRNYFQSESVDAASRSEEPPTAFEKVLSTMGLAETPQQARVRRVKEQQAAIDYWTKRVQTRRVQWDAKMRDAFDRNLYLIDESVNEYTYILQQNPDDALSGEMLDAALDEKMDLLRAFAEL